MRSNAVTLTGEARREFAVSECRDVLGLNFLDDFERLVAFDAERLASVHPKPSSFWAAICPESLGIIIEVGFVEMLREGDGWRKGEMWNSRVSSGWADHPEAVKIHRI